MKESFPETLIEKIEQSASKIIFSLKKGKKILICGCGGSASDSQHFAAELVSKYKLERKALPAIALTVNSSIVTAISNDYSFKTVFSRQIEALGGPGDILFAISTSGNSEAVLEALKCAKKQTMYSIGLTGEGGGKMKECCDLSLNVPSKETPRIQESHILIIHIICELVEKAFYEK
ncbi:MAG: phosphoheptose isomerase, D-sedoheptulose 7-phosphate isomerase [Candidatus Peregrinibacteria bacterium GW2011_GWC2_39_14]|nr:MAG: putative phosphoheptose isomerase [Candidatus Peregrinibacteria bacterium GW2011_GWA2_38_36]KKR07062.1 MAG: phosphoheptose isomerase, D-sedoheptulose 7-phosphate isomerase [Candidatus Peregrinibacteria bacterium GW2011_GWC2_39_14]